MSYQTDEKLNCYLVRQRVAIVLLLVLLVASISLPVGWYVGCRIKATAVLRQAKSTRLAMRYLSIVYTGEEKSLADATQPDGFSEGTAKELCDLAGVEGTLHLLAWDPVEGVPTEYTYTVGQYVSFYRYVPDTKAESWRVCYQLPLLSFTI